MSTRTEEVIVDAVSGSSERWQDGLAGKSSAARPTIPYGRHWISESDIDAMVAVLRSDFVTQGEQMPAFERELGEVLGADSVVALCNGSAALHVAVAALGMGPGDIGVTSAVTFCASASCSGYQQSKVRFVDVDALTGNMDPNHLEAVLANLRRSGFRGNGAVIPVSLAERSASLVEIEGIAHDYGFRVVEDAAHSFGSTYADAGKVRPSAGCQHSDLAILSFHPVKLICTGEGGALVCRDREMAERVRHLRGHGVGRKGADSAAPVPRPDWYYDQTDLGWNYRLTDFQAALGRSQLKRRDQLLSRRRRLARRYCEAFQQSPYSEWITLPPEDSGHAYHLFIIHLADARIRDRVHGQLRRMGIMTQVHYLPLYRHTYYRDQVESCTFAGAEAYFDGCLSIPLYPRMRDSDQDRVITALGEVLSLL